MVKRVLEFDDDSDDKKVLGEIELILRRLMPSWSREWAWLWLIINSLSMRYFMDEDRRGLVMSEDDGDGPDTEIMGQSDAAMEILVKHIDAACDEIKALSLQQPTEQPES